MATSAGSHDIGMIHLRRRYWCERNKVAMTITAYIRCIKHLNMIHAFSDRNSIIMTIAALSYIERDIMIHFFDWVKRPCIMTIAASILSRNMVLTFTRGFLTVVAGRALTDDVYMIDRTHWSKRDKISMASFTHGLYSNMIHASSDGTLAVVATNTVRRHYIVMRTGCRGNPG